MLSRGTQLPSIIVTFLSKSTFQNKKYRSVIKSVSIFAGFINVNCKKYRRNKQYQHIRKDYFTFSEL